jgi:hypothetical protein
MDKLKAIAAVQELLTNMEKASGILQQQRQTLEGLVSDMETMDAAARQSTQQTLNRAVQRLRTF